MRICSRAPFLVCIKVGSGIKKNEQKEKLQESRYAAYYLMIFVGNCNYRTVHGKILKPLAPSVSQSLGH